jgi:hypothetical protein
MQSKGISSGMSCRLGVAESPNKVEDGGFKNTSGLVMDNIGNDVLWTPEHVVVRARGS